MKELIVILSVVSLLFSKEEPLQCGDGKTYAVEKQTKFNNKFDGYEKVSNAPYLDGQNLNEIIEENLKLNDIAKQNIFRLNYMFTVSCNGELKDVKVLGDPKSINWTNIVDIIKNTEGNWIPATREGKNIDCIYFSRKTIVGDKY